LRRFLGRTKEFVLLLLGLEATVSELGGGIDELEFDLFESGTGGLGDKSLTEGDNSLDGTGDGTLKHDVVFVDDTIVDKSTERSDVLDGKIVLGGSVRVVLATFGVGGLTKTVNLLVHLSTVMVTVLTGAGNGVLHAGRVPGTNTGDLTETSVSLTGKTGNTPTGSNTFVTLTLGNGNGINHVVHGEDGINRDLLFEEVLTPVDLIGNGSTVYLDLHKMGLLLSELHLADLGVGEDADNLAVLFHSLEFVGNIVVLLVGDTGGVAGEGFLLSAVPVLVEASLEGLFQVISPNGGEGTETTRGFDVSDKTDDNHRGSLNDSDGFDSFTLVKLGSRLVDLTHDMSHTGLVTHEGGKVAWLGSIISGEGFDATSVAGCALSWEKPKRP